MRTVPLLLLVFSGCVSVQQLVHDNHLTDACERVTLEDESADKALVREALWRQHEDARVQVHAFTIDELEEALDYVPAGLREGRYLLVSLTTLNASKWNGHVGASIQIGTRSECCEVEEWLTLDGRLDELSRLRQRVRAADRRRVRGSTPFGRLLLVGEALGGLFAGFAADILYIGSHGELDVDVRHLPLANLSPVQLIRRLAEQATRSPDDETELDEAQREGARRARSAAVLGALISDHGACGVEAAESSCQVYNLVAVHSGSVLRLDTVTNAYRGGGGSCALIGSYEIGADGDIVQAINGTFTEPLSLRQLGELHRIE